MEKAKYSKIHSVEEKDIQLNADEIEIMENGLIITDIMERERIIVPSGVNHWLFSITL